MNNYNHEKHDVVASDATAPPDGCSPNSRRRLLKVGVSAVPVVLTLTSRPVLAWHCKTPSVAASANLSHHVHQEANEGTRTIADWDALASWSPYFDKDKCTLGDMFGETALAKMSIKCKDAIKDSNNTLVQYLIAAMLNIYYIPGAGLCLSSNQIRMMYKDGPGGNYQPMPGSTIRWGSSQIKTYLQQNWIVTG